MDTKFCPDCRVERPTSNFYRNGSGFWRCCKACAAIIRRATAWERAAKARAWRAANPEAARASVRASHAKHRDKRLANSRAWIATPEGRALNAERCRRYTAENPEKVRAQRARAEAKRKPERKVYLAAYHSTRRARNAEAAGSHTSTDLAEIRSAQGDRCAVCRIKLGGKGAIDHIIALARGGSNDRRNLQWLCKSCNSRKRARDPIEFMQERGLLL
jgi:5-methylcytosine-specific restriction endonuclease McrA